MTLQRDRHAGFTLIETLVAFIVLALLTLVLQRGISDAIGGAARAEARFGAETTARSLLTTPLGPEALSERSLTGRLNGFAWRMVFEPVVEDGASVAGDAPQWRPVRVRIEIFGQGTADPLAVTESLRLVPVS